MKIFEYNAWLTFGTISGAFSENKYFDQQDFIPGVLANPFRSTLFDISLQRNDAHQRLWRTNHELTFDIKSKDRQLSDEL